MLVLLHKDSERRHAPVQDGGHRIADRVGGLLDHVVLVHTAGIATFPTGWSPGLLTQTCSGSEVDPSGPATVAVNVDPQRQLDADLFTDLHSPLHGSATTHYSQPLP